VFALGGVLLAKHLALSLPTLALPTLPNPAINRLLVMFKCYFDAGFIDTQAHVVHRYFAEYFPQAIRTAQQMRQAGSNRYVWTTGSWLLYEYLEQASPEDRRRMEKAIGDGDLAWHALPFSWQTEMTDRSLISGSLSLSHSLDRRFGRTTTGAKMTDVPGHTRGLIPSRVAYAVCLAKIRAARPWWSCITMITAALRVCPAETSPSQWLCAPGEPTTLCGSKKTCASASCFARKHTGRPALGFLWSAGRQSRNFVLMRRLYIREWTIDLPQQAHNPGGRLPSKAPIKLAPVEAKS
jgi:hypothetical protein